MLIVAWFLINATDKRYVNRQTVTTPEARNLNEFNIESLPDIDNSTPSSEH